MDGPPWLEKTDVSSYLPLTSGSPGKPPESNGSLSKFFIGSVALGAAFLAAYQTGYLDQYLKKEHHSVPQEAHVNATIEESKTVQHSTDQLISPNEKLNNENPTVQLAEGKIDTHFSQPEDVIEDQVDKLSPVQDKFNIAEDGIASQEENQLPEYPQSSLTSDDPSKESVVQSDGIIGIKSIEADNTPRPEKGVQNTLTSTQISSVPDENGTENIPSVQLGIQDSEEKKEVLKSWYKLDIESALGKYIEQQPTLLEEYHLRNKSERNPAAYGFSENSHFPEGEEALSGAMDELRGGYMSEDGKLVFDFLQAIHAAEKRQADLDAHVFNEEKKLLKERYEKQLKDAAAMELMLAEEAAMLDKEIEAELKLKQVQELAKAELNAAIANEKAAQIEKMAEAEVNINALCMAFYARSEEARQSHATQNFALRALALEDALSKGLPIEKEIVSLQANLGGIDKDSVLDLVLASLPEETRSNGTDTQLQLKQKFEALKDSVRHFSFFPPGGGGILAHSLAHVASWLKNINFVYFFLLALTPPILASIDLILCLTVAHVQVREDDQSGDGIESVINKVESYLAEGKLAEAADCLEESVRDTEAAEIVAGWARQARNRAISEQAVLLLQSYASSLSLT
ncbi:hypothetical protein V8G54_002028 [Vigna mungo]|uniref:MICOS complex subunit MIC60 n=1 Tax=Vigna mungo TaxID=3915 RepID=A0AAQ3S8R3_VIGMU